MAENALRLQVQQQSKRIAELEADVRRLSLVMYDAAHLAATLGSGSEGRLRGRFMSISNALNVAIGRGQSSHGDQYDPHGNITKEDPLKGIKTTSKVAKR